MPVYKCSNKKFRIGTGQCMYKTRHDAESAYKGYRAAKHMKEIIQVFYIKLIAQRLKSLTRQEG